MMRRKFHTTIDGETKLENLQELLLSIDDNIAFYEESKPKLVQILKRSKAALLYFNNELEIRDKRIGELLADKRSRDDWDYIKEDPFCGCGW